VFLVPALSRGERWSRLGGPGEGVTPERIGKEFPEHPLCEQCGSGVGRMVIPQEAWFIFAESFLLSGIRA